MIVKKKKSEIGTYDIRIEINEDKHLDIVFGGNGDIYWIYDNYEVADVKEDPMYDELLIPKEEDIYSIFNELYEDLINCRIFVPEINELYEGQIEEDKKRCNASNKELQKDPRYLSLVKDDIITWYSDEEYYKIAEILRISKNNQGILLEFIRQSKRDDMESLRLPGWYSIRFRTSGSTYTPCDIVFWRHFNNLQEYQEKPNKVEEYTLKLKKGE